MMQHVDTERLYTDIQYRYDYISTFMGFNKRDQDMLHKSAAVVIPLIPALVDAVYERLFQFDATWEHFAYNPDGIKLRDVSLNGDPTKVNMDSVTVTFRKTMLNRYLKKVVTAQWNISFLKYLDWVGHIHTSTPLKESTINVDYIHCNALFGYLSTVITETLYKCQSWDPDTRLAIISAFSKFFWIQNDFFAKYYLKDKVFAHYRGCRLFLAG